MHKIKSYVVRLTSLLHEMNMSSIDRLTYNTLADCFYGSLSFRSSQSDITSIGSLVPTKDVLWKTEQEATAVDLIFEPSVRTVRGIEREKGKFLPVCDFVF